MTFPLLEEKGGIEVNMRTTGPVPEARSVHLRFQNGHWLLIIDTDAGDRHEFELSMDAIKGILEGYFAVNRWLRDRMRGQPGPDGDGH